MHIGILGPLLVRSDDGQPCLPGGEKQRLLLSLLLLHAPRAVSVDRLVEAMWGERLPDDPTAALRTQLSRLRAGLARAGAPAEVLHSESRGYRLDTTAFDIDAARFESALKQARECADVEAELSCLGDALGLWRGEPWGEFLDHPAFLGAARSLAELRTGAMERRVVCLMEMDRTTEALSEAELLVREDPLRERPQALLMQALYRGGRPHESLSVYQEYRRVLSDELGLDPSPALRELEGAILRHEDLSRASPARSGSGSLVPGRAADGDAAAPATPRDAPLEQAIRFCRAPDGVRLAYATVGSGPPLLKAANWLNHLEFDWESPVWRRHFRELAADRTLIRYDERGSGLSDRNPARMSLDAWVLDLEAVVDACGLERFPLLGISQGCAVCIEYAARHPERVSGLILHGGYAAGWRAASGYPEAEVARREASIPLVRHGWGEDTPAYRQMFTLTFIPGGTQEEIEWFNELERRTVSPEGAARFMEAFAEIDVRHRLAEIRAPTLVLHSRLDQRIHHEQGRELAAGIPGARFVLLESANHLVLEHEPAFDPWIREVRRFLEEEAED
jgi:pimeloyl-ACP methyl ester carboxylesterase/DNA-binding SARP family transcriptional activator